MSELKWNWVYYPHLDAPNKQEESARNAGYIKVVIKDEVDKVIAEKDMQIASLNREIARIQDKMCEDVFEGIVPSKHIVCRPLQQAAEHLAELKKACNAKDDWCLHTLKENRHHKYKRCLAMARMCEKRSEIYFSWSKKMDFILKWKLRWHELAEKFKEAK